MKRRRTYTVGLDYGTSSVRCVIVDTRGGCVLVSSEWPYEAGKAGIIQSTDPNLARQHPSDYHKGTCCVIRDALRGAGIRQRSASSIEIVGIGVGTTGSTPIPVGADGRPLALKPGFAKDLSALAWLWKDHTSASEAAEITETAKRLRPQYLSKCGGTYSSEWFFSKILHCLRIAPKVFNAAYSWVELSDYIPALLTGNLHPDQLKAGVCAAGHKAMYSDDWGGYPDRDFLARFSPRLGLLRTRLCREAYSINDVAGRLDPDIAHRVGLSPGIPVAIGALDAHLGAVGAGIQAGTLVKIIGTSSCDIAVAHAEKPLPDIPGICGIVRDSVLPGYFGLEAGQSAVGDLLNWFVSLVSGGRNVSRVHQELTEQAAAMEAGESGLLALDWNNGNRSLLVDPRLTGLIIGQTLSTTPAEIYRALVEATAFGALTIINRLVQHGTPINRIVACGGIAEKSPLAMQIYADVTGRSIDISGAPLTSALGAAIAAAVVGEAHPNFTAAQAAMVPTAKRVFHPNPEAKRVYARLYPLYQQLHDSFGTHEWKGNLHTVMKQLLSIRENQRGVVLNRSRKKRPN